MEPRRISDKNPFGSLLLQQADDTSNDLAVGGDAELLFGIGEDVRFQQNRLAVDIRHPRRGARLLTALSTKAGSYDSHRTMETQLM